MEKSDLAKGIWSLCTAITGFSILQSLAFAYGFKDPSFQKQVRDARALVSVAAVFGTALYGAAILILTHMLTGISDPDIASDINMVSWMEIGAVALSGAGVAMLGLVAK